MKPGTGYVYTLCIEGRRPEKKTYTDIGHVKSAIRLHGADRVKRLERQRVIVGVPEPVSPEALMGLRVCTKCGRFEDDPGFIQVAPGARGVKRCDSPVHGGRR